MENSEIKDMAKNALDPETLEILRLSLNEDLYPSQIANRLKRSTSYVVKKLKKLEKHGLVKSDYVTRDGKATKRYALITEELAFKVDFKNGNVSIKGKNSNYLDKFVEIHPELFQTYEDYVLWSTGKIQPKKAANYFDVPIEDTEKLLKDIQEDIKRLFLLAFETRFRNWKYGMESGYIDFVEDWLIIPTQKLAQEMGGEGDPLVDRILMGETYLSVLEKEFQKENIQAKLKNLEGDRLIFREKEHRPKLLNYKINLKTKGMLEEEDAEGLVSIGKQVGTVITKFIDLPLETILSTVFGRVNVNKSEERIEIFMQDCLVCEGVEGEKACQFVSGVLSGILESKGLDTKIRETSCKAEGEDACVFHVEIKHSDPIPEGAEKVKTLLGG